MEPPPQTNLSQEVGRVLIEHILHHKGRTVETIPAGATVAEAVARLHEHNIGALVVTGDEPDGETAERRATVAGILSERDVVRALAVPDADAAALLARPVAELMSTDVATCHPRATVDELMRLMTDRRIRHVPVLEGGELAGIVSIGDVLKSRIDELQAEAETLHEYLSSGR
jgi:CBS domain-containing protein